MGGSKSNPSNLSAGNPDLKAQHAWNYDVLAEHFFPSVGVISGGFFYKSITDFIFRQNFLRRFLDMFESFDARRSYVGRWCNCVRAQVAACFLQSDLIRLNRFDLS